MTAEEEKAYNRLVAKELWNVNLDVIEAIEQRDREMKEAFAKSGLRIVEMDEVLATGDFVEVTPNHWVRKEFI